MDKATCGISVIIKTTGMKRNDILAQIEAGNIAAEKRRGLCPCGAGLSPDF